MGIYTRRVQTVLTEEEYERLQEISRTLRRPVSVLVREAVEREYLAAASPERRRAALEELFNLNAPVGEWDHMEREIASGAMEGRQRKGKGRRG